MATNSSSSNIPKKSIKDFKFIKEIGTGSYSTVFFAIETATNRELAIKAVNKDLIKRLKKIPQVFREKEINLYVITRLFDLMQKSTCNSPIVTNLTCLLI
ncbi:unnamed protein product [Rotaria sp. Silwood1]|nr:unnamed protein product [Rotaria sp. Silwood1]